MIEPEQQPQSLVEIALCLLRLRCDRMMQVSQANHQCGFFSGRRAGHGVLLGHHCSAEGKRYQDGMTGAFIEGLARASVKVGELTAQRKQAI